MIKVEIYTSPICGFCWRAKSLLKDKGVEFQEIDVTLHPNRRPEMIQRANGTSTVPQIFIGDAHIGGCDELLALDHKGGLDPLLQAS
ncbi:MAG: glutaredoxin 3 [Pseudomonadota bacterium]|nr:glutaredoxin 3 [Pseudomonadota bacterium]